MECVSVLKCECEWACDYVWLCVCVHSCVYVWIYSIRWEETPVCKPTKLASGTRACQRDFEGFQYLGMISWTSVSSHLSTQGLWGFREGLHLPRGHETSRLRVVVTDGAVGVRWGPSMHPCHLIFSRSHLPKPLLAASRGSGVWLAAFCLEFSLTLLLVHPTLGIRRNHR